VVQPGSKVERRIRLMGDMVSPQGRRAEGPLPLPKANNVSQVFSTYDGLPVAAQMFKRLVGADAVETEGAFIWTFTTECPRGWTMILRSIKVLPVNGGDEGAAVPYVLIPAPSRMRFTLHRNGAALPDVQQVRCTLGEEMPLYLRFGENNSAGCVITSGDLHTGPGLQAIFTGEMLRSRGLVEELEVGHPAAVVKVLPDDDGVIT
jgi:hypothetical protein